MLGVGRQIVSASRRRFSTSVVRRGEWQQEGIPGSNLPFDINNRYKLTAGFLFFFGTGFNAPFFLVRHQILKK